MDMFAGAVLGFETLTDVHWHMSCEVVLLTLLGGMGAVLGPVVGAFTVRRSRTSSATSATCLP